MPELGNSQKFLSNQSIRKIFLSQNWSKFEQIWRYKGVKWALFQQIFSKFSVPLGAATVHTATYFSRRSFFVLTMAVLLLSWSNAGAALPEIAVCETFYYVPAGLRTVTGCSIPCDVPRQADGQPDIVPVVYSGHLGVIASVSGIHKSSHSGAELLQVTLYNVDPLDIGAVVRIELRGPDGNALFHSGFDCAL